MINIKFPTKQTLRTSGLLFSVIFLVLFCLIPYILDSEIRIISFIVFFVTLFLSIFSPYTLRIPYQAWMKFGEILGKFNSNLILIIFFYLIITPAALVRRFINLFRYNSINSKKSFYCKEHLSYKVNLKDQI